MQENVAGKRELFGTASIAYWSKEEKTLAVFEGSFLPTPSKAPADAHPGDRNRFPRGNGMRSSMSPNCL